MELIESALSGDTELLFSRNLFRCFRFLKRKSNKERLSSIRLSVKHLRKSDSRWSRSLTKTTCRFLISLKAGGTGLNLVGADVIIHYDPWWNEAAQNQATDRAHRIGQTKNVLVYKLIVKDTIEEKILKMQEQKSKLADDILSGKGMQSGIIDKDDLMNLL